MEPTAGEIGGWVGRRIRVRAGHPNQGRVGTVVDTRAAGGDLLLQIEIGDAAAEPTGRSRGRCRVLMWFSARDVYEENDPMAGRTTLARVFGPR